MLRPLPVFRRTFARRHHLQGFPYDIVKPLLLLVVAKGFHLAEMVVCIPVEPGMQISHSSGVGPGQGRIGIGSGRVKPVAGSHQAIVQGAGMLPVFFPEFFELLLLGCIQVQLTNDICCRILPGAARQTRFAPGEQEQGKPDIEQEQYRNA